MFAFPISSYSVSMQSILNMPFGAYLKYNSNNYAHLKSVRPVASTSEAVMPGNRCDVCMGVSVTGCGGDVCISYLCNFLRRPHILKNMEAHAMGT